MKRVFIVTVIVLLWYFLYKWAIDISVYTIDSYEQGPTILMIGGTHGNEPAGKQALQRLVQSNINLKRGNIIVIPEANKCGGFLNVRWLMHNWINPDLNRNYTDRGKDDISKKIIEYVHKSDIVIDFHEGWGFRKINPDSMGATISYTTPYSKRLAEKIVEKLNHAILEDDIKFTINEDHDNLLTLRNYANRFGKDYILVETAGQDDVQPIETRVHQDMIIINEVLQNYNLL